MILCVCVRAREREMMMTRTMRREDLCWVAEFRMTSSPFLFSHTVVDVVFYDEVHGDPPTHSMLHGLGMIFFGIIIF